MSWKVFAGMGYSERLRPFHPDTEETRTLQLLVEARREAVDDKTRYSIG